MVFTASSGHGLAALFPGWTFGSPYPNHIRPDHHHNTAPCPARHRSAAKGHQPSAGSHRPAPGRWASLPIHRHFALSLSSTPLARGLSGGLGRDHMQPDRTQHSRRALRGRPQAAIPSGSASGAPPSGGAPLPAAANAEAFADQSGCQIKTAPV